MEQHLIIYRDMPERETSATTCSNVQERIELVFCFKLDMAPINVYVSYKKVRFG